MGELEKWFGPKQKRPSATAAPTSWPKAPEHLRSLLDKWEELHGYGVVPKKQLVNSAFRYHEIVNGSAPLMARVYEYMKSKGLFRKDLGSLITIALEWKDDVDPDSEEARRRYKETWTFDDD